MNPRTRALLRVARMLASRVRTMRPAGASRVNAPSCCECSPRAATGVHVALCPRTRVTCMPRNIRASTAAAGRAESSVRSSVGWVGECAARWRTCVGASICAHAAVRSIRRAVHVKSVKSYQIHGHGMRTESGSCWILVCHHEHTTTCTYGACPGWLCPVAVTTVADQYNFNLKYTCNPRNNIHQGAGYALVRFMSTGGEYDVAIIGGGPGGYVAAIKASQLGLKAVSATYESTVTPIYCV